METFIAALSSAQPIYYATTFFVVASGAAILYDQILNFSQEVDFIWNRRWTIVTALYFVARYSGPVFQFTMLAAILPLNWTSAVNTSIAMASQLSSIVFTTAMQALLLLRAHALCNRSRKVLVVLLVSFVCEMIAIVVVIVKALDLVAMGWLVSFRGPDGRVLMAYSANSYALDLWQTVYRAIQLAFDILLLAVALFGSMRHRLEAQGWSVNPLVKALVEDQIAYFVLYAGSFFTLGSATYCGFARYAVWQGTSLPTISSVAAGVSALEGLSYLFGAFAIIAGPRMVISLREHELKTQEGTLQTQLSTIQFNVRESVHTHSPSSGREVDADG
ncbi:hypothetical protein BV22DRAFT_924799 [Leucogyrophana mollusca]|uniref:Uncharacterized protein n=1 Tax=Leucogyrophana mollusca TaxID=85980 RepID=A0ACB8AXJ4_9AGAM|nr:hypothetical protein BV22DRAFT_924799 [Leucogyrophana mollusca]